MPRILKDPLVHFLALGALLFVFSAMRGGESEDSNRIVVSAAEIERLTGAVSMLQGRPATRDELRPLIEPLIRDEVMYREALALGLDENDDEVRRRLIEKMLYLTLDRADPEPPSEQALRAFYDADPDRFAVPAHVTFEQVFFSPRQRGASLPEDIAEARAALESGADPVEVGDPTPLEFRYEGAERTRVEVLFGASIADALFSLPPGGWQGPYTSDFGEHLLRLRGREPSRLPAFDEARERVAAIYAEAQRTARNEAEYQRLLDRYDVVIEWPDAISAEAAAASAADGEGATR